MLVSSDTARCLHPIRVCSLLSRPKAISHPIQHKSTGSDSRARGTSLTSTSAPTCFQASKPSQAGWPGVVQMTYKMTCMLSDPRPSPAVTHPQHIRSTRVSNHATPCCCMLPLLQARVRATQCHIPQSAQPCALMYTLPKPSQHSKGHATPCMSYASNRQPLASLR